MTIGADSMLRYRAQGGDDYEGFCKINVWHNVVVWALAGAYDVQSIFIPTPFIPADIINQELSRDSNISEALTTIENIFRARLDEILSEMKRKLPSDAFKRDKGEIALEGVFAYVHNGHPEIEGMRIRLDALDQVRIEARHCPGSGCDRRGIVVQLGFWEEIESEAMDPSVWKDAPTAIKRFIEEEADAHPKAVGPPVSLIRSLAKDQNGSIKESATTMAHAQIDSFIAKIPVFTVVSYLQ